MNVDRRVARLPVFFVTMVLLSTASALAQSSIAGVARDTTGAVLPGVTVEATSPALIEKSRAVITDEQGVYKLVDLRPGTYAVTFTLSGFNTVRREGIDLPASFTATVNAEMRVGAVSETVTVTAQSPLVDVQNVRQHQGVPSEVIDTIPTGRTFQSLAALIPGTVSSANTSGSTQDVGGLAGEGSELAIHGGHFTDTLILLNGIIMTNSSKSSIRINTGMTQEFSYETGSIPAQYSNGGVVINIIPREGGNHFSGSLFGTFANHSLQSDNLNASLKARGLTSVNSLDKIWDINPSVGGPIKRDKVWFYASTRYWGTDVLFAGLYHAQNPASPIFTPDLSRPAVNDTWTLSNDGRVTWQVTPRNKIIGHIIDQPRRSLAVATFGAVVKTPEALAFQHIPINRYGQVSWTSPITSRLLFEAGVGIFRTMLFNQLSDGVSPTSYSYTDQGLNLAYGAPQNYQNLHLYNNDYRGAVTYITGSHAFKAGMNAEISHPETWNFVNNDIDLTLLNGQPRSITLNTTPQYTTAHTALMGLFAQDQWTLKRWTFNGGLRLDVNRGSVPAQHVPAVQFVGARDFPEVTNVPSMTDLSPRVGVAYDVFGDSRTAIKATLSRYVGVYSIASANNPVNTSVNAATRTWTDLNGDYVPQCDFLNPVANLECGPLSNLNFGKPNITTVYDKSVTQGFNHSPYNWEASLGLQHQLFASTAVNAAYFRRWYGNFQVTDNLLVSPSDYDPYCVTGPVDPRLPSSGQAMCGLYDITPAKFGRVSNLVTAASAYGQQTEIYNGVDVTANSRLPHGAFLQGGVSMGRTATNNCFVVDSPQQARPGFCNVTPPFQASVRISATYPMPWSMQLSGSYQTNPGPMITASYAAKNSEIAPSLGRSLASGVNGTANVDLIQPGTVYEDRMHQVDLRVTRNFRVANVRIRGNVDLFNVFNASPVLTLFTQYGANWLRPTNILDGRLLKFSAQVNF